MWISVIMTLVTAVAGRPMGKSLSKVLKYGAQVAASPQMQTVLYGNANMGSLSWGEITQMYRVLTHQVEVIREEVREAEEWFTYLRNTGIGVVTAFSLLVLLVIVWSFRSWGLIRKIFSKIRNPLPQSGNLESIRKNMTDFLKIRGMPLPEDYLGHRAQPVQPVSPFNNTYGYHMPSVQMGAPPTSNQQSPPVYSGQNPQNPSG